ncbi:formylglycine-generating enzyme family protein [Flagellimonas pacifica]|uniref:Formylglycine-generating enzyme, required for sulfatase activity, contains SUMF1/FGE domain n=1 Tax=Flagellimonas pacifica TaxID=1247520 RepID=A0A285MBJ5_9FLAO|nr:formylglycine-generating enzyme family protein [Allomuricauda parva]SNY94458.1 Formylglycine-generating enzyme, required for sulfatase activity, contains SUMF1/FGE domain [Allomuricauda parva]
MLRTSLTLFIMLLCIPSIGQKKFDPYKQKISGTNLTISMVPIPGGSFSMGSPNAEKDRSKDEGPLHNVEIAPFWMADLEVTWDLYQLFMSREIDNLKDNGSKGNEVSLDVDAVSGATTPYVEMSFGMGTEGYPAICMTQYAASKFCEWLSAMTGNFYRLPTEAEWEYACRAGTQTPYSFGDSAYQISDYAWHSNNSNNKYQKVGQKKPNPWGLYDMHGNVAEWTLDAYNPDIYSHRKGKKTTNPFEKPVKTYPRVVRGGSWKDGSEKLRSASRVSSEKRWKMRDPQIPKSKWWHTDATFVGFRIVRPYNTPSQQEQKTYWKQKHTK